MLIVPAKIGTSQLSSSLCYIHSHFSEYIILNAPSLYCYSFNYRNNFQKLTLKISSN